MKRFTIGDVEFLGESAERVERMMDQEQDQAVEEPQLRLVGRGALPPEGATSPGWEAPALRLAGRKAAR